MEHAGKVEADQRALWRIAHQGCQFRKTFFPRAVQIGLVVPRRCRHEKAKPFRAPRQGRIKAAPIGDQHRAFQPRQRSRESQHRRRIRHLRNGLGRHEGTDFHPPKPRIIQRLDQGDFHLGRHEIAGDGLNPVTRGDFANGHLAGHACFSFASARSSLNTWSLCAPAAGPGQRTTSCGATPSKRKGAAGCST